MIAIRTKREIDLLRKANQAVNKVLATLAEYVKPGVTTDELDAMGEELIRESGGTPSFLGYPGAPGAINFPKSTCISVDEVIVHGIPGSRTLKEGEIVSIDVGVCYKGYHGDAALSMPCGKVDEERARLMATTELALANGLAKAVAGNFLVDVSRAIQNTCEPEGFSVVRNFVGHGIGTEMHEEPQIPNFDTGKRGPRLKKGMVMAIEPMVNLGSEKVKVLSDGWTAITADKRPSAHFEHSIAIRDGLPDVLSASERRFWSNPKNATA
jgi:methionyl aminopeptidase